MNNEVKSEQLGMPFGTASAKLRKTILYMLLKKHNENFCFKCGNEILSEEELSIEHKIPWLHSENPIKLFFDIDNIAFSHLSCNISDKRCLKMFKGTSKYKGVYYDKTGHRNKRWRAVVQNNGKIEKLGRFLTEIDAAKAYDKRAIEIFGNKAVLNFK